jgi:hypothetical protein
MTYFQKAFAVLAALILSVAFAKVSDAKTKTIEGRSSGTSTGGSTGSPPGPTGPKAPKKNNTSTVKTQSIQKATHDKSEAGSENINRQRYP